MRTMINVYRLNIFLKTTKWYLSRHPMILALIHIIGRWKWLKLDWHQRKKNKLAIYGGDLHLVWFELWWQKWNKKEWNKMIQLLIPLLSCSTSLLRAKIVVFVFILRIRRIILKAQKYLILRNLFCCFLCLMVTDVWLLYKTT